MMAQDRRMVVVAVDGQRYALPLAVVVRVVRAIEVTPLPDCPPAVLGVINVQGSVIPLYSLRRRFGKADREIQLEDQLVIVRSGSRTVALLVDEVRGVVECEPRRIVPVEQVEPHEDFIRAVVKLDDALALVPDLDVLLSLPGVGLPGDVLPTRGP